MAVELSAALDAFALVEEEEKRLGIGHSFGNVAENEFRRRYHFSKRTVRWLCSELDPIIGCQRANGISTQQKLLCALRFFATGCFQRNVGCEEFFNLVSDTIYEVAHAIDTIGQQKRWIAFPSTAAARAEAKASFARLGRLPGVLGCVDSTLVAIQRPQGLSFADTANFMSVKGFYAIHTMIVCDAHLWIQSINYCYTGGCHKSWVWLRHSLRHCLEAELRPGEYLLGDSDYPLEPWLLTPVPGNPASSSPEGRYNREHSAMQTVVKRCIRVLKSRFHCLQRSNTLLFKPDRAAIIIGACATLHNIALAAREHAPDEEELEEDDDDYEVPPDFEDIIDDRRIILSKIPREVRLKGRQQRNRVVNLFRRQRDVHADHLRRARRRVLRSRWQHPP